GPFPRALFRPALVSRVAGAARTGARLVCPLWLAEPARLVAAGDRRSADGGGRIPAHAVRAFPDRGGVRQDGALCSVALADRHDLTNIFDAGLASPIWMSKPRTALTRRRTMPTARTETDTFGPIEVAADRYWGAQAQRSLGNFRIGWEKQPLPVVRALGIVKRAAAEANMEFG